MRELRWPLMWHRLGGDLVEQTTLHVYSGLTGAHIGRVEFTSVNWSDSLNEAGSLTATLPYSAFTKSALKPYGTILALQQGRRVLHAGYVTHYKLSNSLYTVDCGGGMTILEKRLVLNHGLAQSWKDGYVLIDEEHPAGEWPLYLTGSYSDIISGLIGETKKWGTLPIVPAAKTGGYHERTYNSYDFATVASRIVDIGALEDGPEFRFDPVIDDSGALSFVQRTAEEIIDSRWRWNSLIPKSPVALGEEDADGGDMCTQCFASGGKDKDRLLVAFAASGVLTSSGWPLLQMADSSHSSVSELPTLKSYAIADVLAGDDTQDTLSINVRKDVPAKVGDWADVRTKDGVLELKITDVSGSTSSSCLTVQCRKRWD